MSVKVLKNIPEGKRHKWFGSMASSQALTQSVFGNLAANGKLDCLRALVGDDGKPIFIGNCRIAPIASWNSRLITWERKGLGEPAWTLFLMAIHRIAVECKLSEQEVRELLKTTA